MIKSFKYRLYPNKTQVEKLQWVLEHCRELYNAALQERKEAWKYARKSISYYGQSASLKDVREVRPEYNDISILILRDSLQRVHKAMEAFFRRIKAGEKPGYPRFLGKNRYHSFTFVQNSGFSLTQDNHLTLYKIGSIKIKLHRPVEGKIKTCTVKREGEQWYAIFVCEVEQAKMLAYTDEIVGIDLGITHFATISTGDTIEHPHYDRRSEKKLVKLQRHAARKKRGSKRRKKAVRAVAKVHRKVRNQRRDFLHKRSRQLVNTYDTLVFEDLRVANLTKRPKLKQDENGRYLRNGRRAKAGLSRSILDAGWAEFVVMCSYKAAWAGRMVLQVNPHMTSQICSNCGIVIKKELDERWHSCPCGCELDRDHNAALNILRLGQRLQEQSCK